MPNVPRRPDCRNSGHRLGLPCLRRGVPRPILDKLTDALDKAPALERLRNAINAEAAKEPSRFWATVQEYVNSLLVKAGVA